MHVIMLEPTANVQEDKGTEFFQGGASHCALCLHKLHKENGCRLMLSSLIQ